MRPLARTGRIAWRNLAGELHLWLGLVLCLPLVAIGLSGSLLVYHAEIEAFLSPANQVTTQQAAPAEARPPAEILAAAQAASPRGFQVAFLRLPSRAGEPALVGFAKPGASPRGGPRLEIDPLTLEAAEPSETTAGGFMRAMHVLHGSLMIPGGLGREIVGWLGIVMLVLGLSGLVIWWPRRGRLRQALTVKWRAGPQRLNRDLHGATGIWSWLVFVVVSFSGAHIVFPQTFTAGYALVLPDQSREEEPAPRGEVAAPGALDLAAAAAIAVAALPEAEVRMARMPFRPGQSILVVMNRPEAAPGAPAITLDIDPSSGALLAVRDPAAMPAAERLAAWMRPLHEGQGLGPVWRLLVFLSGLLPALFSVTGIAFWLLRRRSRRRLEARKRPQGGIAA